MNELKEVIVSNINKDINKNEIIAIYKSTFDTMERIPLFVVKRRIKQHKYIMSKYFDKDKLIGLSMVFPFENYVLIHYIVIFKEFRNHGYGTKLLDLIKEKYKNKTLLLSSEYYDENEPNRYKQRRIDFYISNKLIVNDFVAIEYGVYYFVLSSKKITKNEYYKVISNSFNKLLVKLFVKVKEIN